MSKTSTSDRIFCTTQSDVLWWGIKKNKSLTKKALMALRELLFRGNDMRHRSTVVDSRVETKKKCWKRIRYEKKKVCMHGDLLYGGGFSIRVDGEKRRKRQPKIGWRRKKRENVFQEISASHSFLSTGGGMGMRRTGRVVWKSEWKNSSSSGTHRTQQSERILARSGEKTSVRMENWFCAQFSECGKEHSQQETKSG